MASVSREEAGFVLFLFVIVPVLCCGAPLFAGWKLGDDSDARAAMKPVVTAFFDAWRDGDAQAAARLACDDIRDDVVELVREPDVASYDSLTVGTTSGKYGTSYFADAILEVPAHEDGGIELGATRREVRLKMEEKDDGWRVCYVS